MIAARPAVATNRTLLGVVIFIASESIFFLAIVLAYIAYREAGLATAKATLDLGRTAIFSLALFGSSATMIGGRLRMTTAMLFAVGFIAMFVIGGLSGVSLAVVPIDLAVTDSYYVVAHLHYVLFGGTMLGIFVGMYWHFVDAVWVVVFSVVYLGTLL
ncbi:MAG: hypothetical protein E6I14_02040 [Chloroflexi bacterium]|nr:MAG: hypothetical protein E6I14_02040 [Chloroflexota bacterium]